MLNQTHRWFNERQCLVYVYKNRTRDKVRLHSYTLLNNATVMKNKISKVCDYDNKQHHSQTFSLKAHKSTEISLKYSEYSLQHWKQNNYKKVDRWVWPTRECFSTLGSFFPLLNITWKRKNLYIFYCKSNCTYSNRGSNTKKLR